MANLPSATGSCSRYTPRVGPYPPLKGSPRLSSLTVLVSGQRYSTNSELAGQCRTSFLSVSGIARLDSTGRLGRKGRPLDAAGPGALRRICGHTISRAFSLPLRRLVREIRITSDQVSDIATASLLISSQRARKTTDC